VDHLLVAHREVDDARTSCLVGDHTPDCEVPVAGILRVEAEELRAPPDPLARLLHLVDHLGREDLGQALPVAGFGGLPEPTDRRCVVAHVATVPPATDTAPRASVERSPRRSSGAETTPRLPPLSRRSAPSRQSS